MNDIIRRDPRREWIIRNRLHPQHHEVTMNVMTLRGASGVLRKNPHVLGYIGPNGIKRIDRMNVIAPQQISARGVARAAEARELPLHRVDQADYYVAVVPDMVGGRLSSHDRDAIGQAHALIRQAGGAGAVVVIVFAEHRETQFALAGVDRLMLINGSEYAGYSPEARTQVLAQVEQEIAPRYWLFPDSISGGFELGCRLAARIGERPATQAWKVDTEQTLCRGAAGTQDIARMTPRVLLLAEECADHIDETRHEVLPLALSSTTATRARIVDEGPVAVDPNAVALGEAEFILSAGNGVHHWAQFHQTAQALGATEGASRVAVDNGDMPRFRQVGATGTWVTARVYVAVGISGAVQHLQGIGQCDKVIAINTDISCDMVKRAALSVIADSDEILAELQRLVQQNRKEALDDAA
ncbi:electron transfer flavoprotein subunit alpha [Candidatus Pantoea multigeneris]|uniref:Electron transfer flavoprotein subunit alpha/FixB family protein n=1 Tax=Candidatus Pantoea multigeneris TaxID=2608357 RepID=A0ABX0RGH8_9GAMM|nr:electron transfer flavoprotein subunit alpha/FixB family protein [Pantoea multigeneris]NIF23238.1 electron transfer flavoprotein subunit alpha/FixB family protein [Pantoea multigeneris]